MKEFERKLYLKENFVFQYEFFWEYFIGAYFEPYQISMMESFANMIITSHIWWFLCDNMVLIVIKTSSFYNVSFFVALIALWYYWSILKKLDHEMKVSTLSSRIWYVKDSSFHTHSMEYSKILQNTLQNIVLIRGNTGQWKLLFLHILCSHIYLQNALAYA